jgi:hypothetical protein
MRKMNIKLTKANEHVPVTTGATGLVWSQLFDTQDHSI